MRAAGRGARVGALDPAAPELRELRSVCYKRNDQPKRTAISGFRPGAQDCYDTAHDTAPDTAHAPPMTPPMTPSRTMIFTTAAPATDALPPQAQRAALTGCPWHDVKAMLREVGLRPTRQRMELGWLMFGKGDRHFTAEMLYEEANKAKVPVSLATFFVEDENALFDIPDAEVFVGRPPVPPEGYEIARIDVVVRLRRKAP